MKLFVMMTAGICMFLLNGCMTFNETKAPELTAKFASETKLRLEGFILYSIREKQHHTGYSSSVAYDFKRGAWLTGSSSYSGTTYERLPDEKFPAIVRDLFEHAGANIRSDKPQLTVEGRIGDGRYQWSAAEMWYRDVPLMALSVCTLGMVISRERENDVKLIVYDQNGKRLKEYNAVEHYYTAGIGIPLSMLVIDRVRAWYCDRMAAQFALIKCVNEFIRDCNSGAFK